MQCFLYELAYKKIAFEKAFNFLKINCKDREILIVKFDQLAIFVFTKNSTKN